MAETTPAPELKTYTGNCHCGAFKYNIQIPELTSVMECNCSICSKKAYKWVFPGAGCFSIEKGDGSLRDYEFGKHSMLHQFCPICGNGILGKRHGMTPGMDIGVNARTLQDIDLWSLEVNEYNGAALEPQYKSPKFTGPEPTASIIDCKLYTGSCHCGAVTMALKVKGPLSQETEVIGECDCSICSRRGTRLTYRPPNQVTISLNPGTTLTTYRFGLNKYPQKFCPVCGITVCVEDTEENEVAVNLRCLEGVEWEDIEIFKADSKRLDPLYIVPE